MYKFLFVALLGSAIFPEWPVTVVQQSFSVVHSIEGSTQVVSSALR